jgi:pimeloyl-ACP methyl ester carboxylesterase
MPTPQVATLLGLQRPSAIDVVVFEPPEAPRGAVVFLHGSAGNFDMPCWQIARAVAVAGALTACPSTGGSGEWATPEGEATLRRTVDALRARGLARVVLMGLSNGGIGASELAPRMKGAFAGLVLFSGAAELAPTAGVPTLVLHGKRDTHVSPESSIAYAEATGARYVELDAGHFAMLVRAREVGPLVTAFVRERLSPPLAAW